MGKETIANQGAVVAEIVNKSNRNFTEIYDDILQIRLFKSESERDDWFTANLNELLENDTYIVVVDTNVLKFQSWTGSTNPSSYSSSPWQDRSFDEISGARIKVLYEQQPNTNAFEDSYKDFLDSITETADEIQFPKGIFAPVIRTNPGSIELGGLTVDSAHHTIGAINQTDNSRALGVAYNYDDSGNEVPFIFDFGGIENDPLQELTDTLQPNDEETFTVTPTRNVFLRGLVLNAAETGDHNYTIRRNGEIITTGTINFSVLGEQTYRLDNSILLFNNETVQVTISGAKVNGTMAGGQFIPRINQLVHEFSTRDIAMNDNIPTTEAIEDIVGSLVVAGNGIGVAYDDDNGRLIITNTGSGGTPMLPTPVIRDFSIAIPSRVDIGTDLNTERAISYDVLHSVNLTSLILVVTDGDDINLTIPVSDGVQNINATLAGIDTTSDGTVTFQLRGIDSEGNTINSNLVTVSIRNLEAHENLYYGLSNTNNPADVDLATLTSVEAVAGDTDVSTGATTLNQYFIVLAPNDHDITEIIDDVLNEPVRDLFTRTPNVRQVGAVNYNSYVIGPLNADDDGETYTLTLN